MGRLDDKETSKLCGVLNGGKKCFAHECCSTAGFCVGLMLLALAFNNGSDKFQGTGKDFCAVPANCQRGFGWCDSENQPKGYNTSEDSRPLVGEVPYGQLITKCKVPRTIALTYDDGPTDNTEELLDILKEFQAKATFFITGITNGKGAVDETEKWKNTVQRMHDEGHQVASHTWSHRDLNKISTLDRKVEMVKMEQALDNILDMYPTYMRPPYLQCSTDTGCQKDIGDLGYHLIGWSTDSTDWLHEGNLDAMIDATDAAIDSTDVSGNMLLIQHDSIQLSAINLTKHILPRIVEKGWHGKHIPF